MCRRFVSADADDGVKIVGRAGMMFSDVLSAHAQFGLSSGYGDIYAYACFGFSVPFTLFHFIFCVFFFFFRVSVILV